MGACAIAGSVVSQPPSYQATLNSSLSSSCRHKSDHLQQPVAISYGEDRVMPNLCPPLSAGSTKLMEKGWVLAIVASLFTCVLIADLPTFISHHTWMGLAADIAGLLLWWFAPLIAIWIAAQNTRY